MTEEKKQSLHPISEILCETYNTLFLTKEVFFPLQDVHIDKLDTIVKTVYGDYFGTVRFPSLEEKAAAFFCLIIKDHPVVDGNKRLSVLWLQIFCKMNNLTIDTSRIPLDVLAVSVEKTKDLSNDELFSLVKLILF